MYIENHKPDKKDRLIRNGWRGWLTLYGLWAIPGLLMTSGYYYAQTDMSHGMVWWLVIIDHMWYFSLLASFCPPMYWVLGRFPFTRASWRLTAEVHILGIGLIVFLVLVLTGVQRALFVQTDLTIFDAVFGQLTNKWFLYRTVMSMVYYVVVVSSMIIVKWHRQRKVQEIHTKKLELQTAQLESQLNHAKLQTLKMQLRPHFLFNALNTISALVESKQNDRAFKTIAQLGDLLRSSLKLPDSTTIPLHLELEFIEKYLTIERIRFSDRLRTRTDVSPEFMEVMVPALILQPLVENCIHHAAAVQSEPLQVTITAFRKGNSLTLEVRDDGPGLPRAWDITQNAGVGLGNISQRLRMMYGESFGLDLFSREKGGVSARVTVPFSQPVTASPELLKDPTERRLIKPAHDRQPGHRAELEHEHSYHNS